MAISAEALTAEMTAEAGAPIEAPPLPAGVPIDDSGSLADHQQKYHEEPAEQRNPRGQFAKRDRESTRATPEDVPKIQELTARARAAEEAIGIKQEPGESDRVFNIRRRAELAERVAKVGAPAAPAEAKPEPVA